MAEIRDLVPNRPVDGNEQGPDPEPPDPGDTGSPID